MIKKYTQTRNDVHSKHGVWAIMSALDQGSTQASRLYGQPQYLTNADPGFVGTSTASDTMPTLQQWENIFGPAARDIKQDSQRHKRHQR